MNHNRTYYIVLDTETANSFADGEKTDLTQSMTYDIGWSVIDRSGNVYEERSFTVDEIFNGEPEMMDSAYYANKLPQYREDLANGTRQNHDLYTIRNILFADCRNYNVRAIVAHNARFDYRALNNTQRWLTSSKYRFFLPYGIDVWDTLQMAQDTYGKQKTYIKWCQDNGYMTKHKVPRPRLTAEILYRYITNNNDFVESHTGLEDTQIERVIFVRCMNQHKKMRRSIFFKEI